MPKVCGYLRESEIGKSDPRNRQERRKKPARRKCAGALATVIRVAERLRQEEGCERLMTVPGIGGCIRYARRAGCGDAGVGKVR
jgi:hypothetical protein